MKRIVTIQDISCVGKCSLTVALPIISAMGVEAAIMPTAVLSNHTAFTGWTFHDLTGEMDPIAEQWKKEKIDYDAIYTGYMGSAEQIDIVERFFNDFKTEDNIIVVDPAMADNGKLYAGFAEDFPKEMARLVAKSDVVLPNITEACYLLDRPYLGTDYKREDIENILKNLCKLGAKISVLTGIGFEEDKLGVMAYDSEKDEFFEYYNEKMDCAYHGTGDVFASCFTGALMNGFDYKGSLKIAVDYTLDCIKKTLADPKGNWYGVNFEEAIAGLVEMIKH